MLDSVSKLGVVLLHSLRMYNDFWLGTGLKLEKKKKNKQVNIYASIFLWMKPQDLIYKDALCFLLSRIYISKLLSNDQIFCHRSTLAALPIFIYLYIQNGILFWKEVYRSAGGAKWMKISFWGITICGEYLVSYCPIN